MASPELAYHLDPPVLSSLALRAAHEGVPVAAIARVLSTPYDSVLNTLARAVRTGQLAALPRPDWSPAARKPPLIPPELEFLCRVNFALTGLEAGFLCALIRSVCAEKEKLHAVIELQRHNRHMRPDRQEVTDPKMVDVMICKLRKKLLAIDKTFVVHTSWGKGYFLELPTKERIIHRLSRPVFGRRRAA